MTILTGKTIDSVAATGVEFFGDTLCVHLSDGRQIRVPLEKVSWLKWLRDATPDQRVKWSLEPGGFAVYWDELDDGIEVCHLLEERPLG